MLGEKIKPSVTDVKDPQRRGRRSSERVGRRLSGERNENFGRGFERLGDLALQGVQVSARAVCLSTGRVLFSADDHVVMPTAGVGKVLLLIEVAARLQDPDFNSLTLLERTPADAVAGTGIWQHMQAPTLPIADLAALVGANSDNLATNVLLREIGLDAVRARAESIGLRKTALLDKVRDRRGPDEAPQLSVASANELTWLFSALARGEVVSPAVSQRVIGWLSLGTDLSMVASSFGLDPQSHREADHGILLVNKTGGDVGIRAEAGVLRGPRSSVAYAVFMSFADTRLAARLAVLEGMRAVGTDLLEYVH